MVEKLWVYNLDAATVDWAYAYPAWTGNSRWICRTDGDGTQTRETIGYGVFMTEKEATTGLLKALVSSKGQIESDIDKVQIRLSELE
jgi:hypothetical protein